MPLILFQLVSRLATCSSKTKSVVLTKLDGQLNLHLVRANSITTLSHSIYQCDVVLASLIFCVHCIPFVVSYVKEFQTAMKWWLEVNSSLNLDGNPMVCLLCPNCAFNPLGHHCVTCKRGGDITTRHNTLHNVVYNLSASWFDWT